MPRTLKSLVCILLAALCASVLAGCVGGTVPSEQILRIDQPDKGQYAGESRHFSGPMILMENLDCFPALDRSAVMLARGNVLTPSSRWYWEGAPAAITSASIASHLQSLSEFTLVWPSRNRLEHEAMLTGRVEAFEVREQDSVMKISLHMSLWTERGKRLLLTHAVEVKEPLSTLSPQAIAQAASKGMATASKRIGEWLRTEGLKAIAAAH